MRGFNCNADKLRRAGYQKHHLIPVAVYNSRSFETMFRQIQILGFDPRDFSTNGIWLPGTESIAIATGRPLHRGPHPHYTMLVRESIAALTAPASFPRDTANPVMEMAKRICWLQGSLRRALSLERPALVRVGQDMDAACYKLAAEYTMLAASRTLS
jgi:hypothetical protein